jgi:hypothetical protein
MTRPAQSRPARAAVILACAALALAGCGPASRQVAGSVIPEAPPPPTPDGCQSSSLVGDALGAAPLCQAYKLSSTSQIWAADADALDSGYSVRNHAIAFIAAAISDSRLKCQRFVTRYTITRGAEEAAFTTTGLVLAGLGGLLTGGNVARALSGASAAVQGAKESIDSNVFQKVSSGALIQAVGGRYQAAMDKYVDDVFAKAVSDANFRATVALVMVERIHARCSVQGIFAPDQPAPANPPVQGVAGKGGSS